MLLRDWELWSYQRCSTKKAEWVRPARNRCDAGLKVLAPSDDVGTGEDAQLGDAAETGEGAELLDIDPISLAGFGIGDVGEPFELGQHFGELAYCAGVSMGVATGTAAFPVVTRSLAIAPR